MRTYSLSTLVDQLRGLHETEITSEAVTSLLAEADLADSSLSPYIAFSSAKYMRSLVHRCLRFDVLLLCWEPGQQTPIHNHSGQRGWVRVLRGRMEEASYRTLSQEPPPWAWDVAVPVEQTGTQEIPAGRGVVTVDRVRSIHRLGNPARFKDDERAVTLHVYSRPHNSCMVYDELTGKRERREFVFDTVNGLSGALRAADVPPSGAPSY